MDNSLNSIRAIPGSPWIFANEMKKMINNKTYSNVKFVVGTDRVEIYGNTCILSARSEVFKAMFENEDGLHSVCLDEPIILPNVQADTFLCLLEFLYTNCCSLNDSNVVNILIKAAEYSLKELERICGQYMADTISLENACSALQVAVLHELDELKAVALDFVETYAEKVFKTDGFNELSEEALSVLLASDNLTIDEIDLIMFIKQWAIVNSIALGKPVKELTKNVITYIRFTLLSTEELSLVEAENSKDFFIPVKLISDAWKFHALKSSSSPLSSTTINTRTRSGGKVKL